MQEIHDAIMFCGALSLSMVISIAVLGFWVLFATNHKL